MSNDLPIDFSENAVLQRMKDTAALIWRLTPTEINSLDPLINLLLRACASEFKNVAKDIEATRHRILDQLANALCPDVFDFPHPAHAILYARPNEPAVKLPQTAQFVHQQAGQEQNHLIFSPVVEARLVNAEIRFVLSQYSMIEYQGPNHTTHTKNIYIKKQTDYQSIWLGIEADSNFSLDYLSIYFNWAKETEANRAKYARKLTDTSRATLWLDGKQLSARSGFRTIWPSNSPLDNELDTLHQLEKSILNEYNNYFITLDNDAADSFRNYTPQAHPNAYTLTADQQKLFKDKLIWLEIRLTEKLPPTALERITIRLNCFPVMNRRFNESIERLRFNEKDPESPRAMLNVFPLRSVDEFLFIRKVHHANGSPVYQQSPLSHADTLTEGSFMWRPYGVGRFDQRDARQLIHDLQNRLRDENKAFLSLDSGMVSQIVDQLEKYASDLYDQVKHRSEGDFRVGFPYIFIRPRPKDTNLFIEYWSTQGELGNHIVAYSYLTQYQGLTNYTLQNDAIYLVTPTVGGTAKPSSMEKEYKLRRDLLTRNRIVTVEDIKAACRAYFSTYLNTEVTVEVTKGFTKDYIPNAGYVRCLNIVIQPLSGPVTDPLQWDIEVERCYKQLEAQSTMNLPYRVRWTQAA